MRKSHLRLTSEARDWYTRLRKNYGVDDDAGLLLLQTVAEAFDRMRAAQLQIEADGQTITDRFHQVKPHPLLTVERDARSQMLLALKQLNFDVEPLRDRPGNPSGGIRRAG